MTYGCTACMTHGCRWEQTLAKKNPFKRLADLRDDVEEFEVVDELASAIQLADQYCYSNTFIYTQPGNGAPSMVTPPPPLEAPVLEAPAHEGVTVRGSCACASSGRTWRLWAARHRAARCPATASLSLGCARAIIWAASKAWSPIPPPFGFGRPTRQGQDQGAQAAGRHRRAEDRRLLAMTRAGCWRIAEGAG